MVKKLKSNCKVHFAGTDNSAQAIAALRAAGVNYRLITSYPFIVNRKDSYRVKNFYELDGGFKHIIIDSGLFTLMFGAQRDNQLTEKDLREWMYRIVQFAEDNNLNSSSISFVECDCQKLTGPDFAWQLRREMREAMAGRDIINVFHLEDGPDGFDRLVEFSDYIAISVPELRINKRGKYKEITATLTRRARQIKPNIRIHLLGCTEADMLRQNSFVTSSDSSSWTFGVRHNKLSAVRGTHVSRIKPEKLVYADSLVCQAAKTHGLPMRDKCEARIRRNGVLYFDAITYLQRAINTCGQQD